MDAKDRTRPFRPRAVLMDFYGTVVEEDDLDLRAVLSDLPRRRGVGGDEGVPADRVGALHETEMLVTLDERDPLAVVENVDAVLAGRSVRHQIPRYARL